MRRLVEGAVAGEAGHGVLVALHRHVLVPAGVVGIIGEPLDLVLDVLAITGHVVDQVAILYAAQSVEDSQAADVVDVAGNDGVTTEAGVAAVTAGAHGAEVVEND